MDTKSQKRRHRSDTESDSENDDTWPRFIIISPSEPEKLLKLSPFAIQKGIEGLAGNPKSIRKLRSGDLLVEISKKAHAKNILNSKMLANIPVKCSPHKALNSSRGVFRCSELKYCTEAEIKNELKDQGVTDIRRIKSRRNGMLLETNSYIVTYGFPKLPSCIKIGYINCKVEIYIPNPQRCFKCQKFGYYSFTCRGTARCPKCGLDNEIEIEIDCFHEAMEDHQPAIIDPGGNIPKPSSIKKPMRQHILQWNCRSIRKNFNDIQLLINEHNPVAICLQETFLPHNHSFHIRNFTGYHHTHETDNQPKGGVSILIGQDTPQSEVHIDTNLQVKAVKITTHKTITLCSMYVPPFRQLTESALNKVLDQLPRPYLIMGDFNAHSILWGNDSTDSKGRTMENIISDNNLCLFNNKSTTYLHPATGAKTSIDLTLSSPNIFIDYSWQVLDDVCGSDHYPIKIDSNEPSQIKRNARWIFNKADWVSFKELCKENISKEVFENTVDSISTFTSILYEIATKTIPKTSTNPKFPIKPWFNDECIQAVNERKRALYRFEREPTLEKKIEYKRLQAKSRKIIKTNKRKSWHEYVNKLQSSTPIKKVWDKVKKIEGKETNTVSHLKKNNSEITDVKEMSNVLADSFSKNSSSKHYSKKFQKHKKQSEGERLKFKSNNEEDYNRPFLLRELRSALNKSNNTATGPDDIHYQIINQLPEVTLNILLDLFNDIWQKGTFPEIWKEATIIPIPKRGKDHSNPQKDRPIALTSCLCKTLERMINDRLVWFLESNNLLTNIQSGFRHNRTTTDHLIKLENFIREGFIRNEHVVAIFFDLEKAYDTTWKHGILKTYTRWVLGGDYPILSATSYKTESLK